jgi:hypothetical protein
MAGIARMRTIVLDCPDPLALARFYGELLGWEVIYADDITGAIKWGDANFAFPQLRRLRAHTLWPPP